MHQRRQAPRSRSADVAQRRDLGGPLQRPGSLSGGALPLADGIVLGLAKFNRILEIDYDNRCVRAQPGVTNLGITNAVQHEGFYYAPDPSSQIACTIGGNIAENSGGVHCLKYGLTTNNVLGLEIVLMTGEVVRLGGKHLDAEGYDLLGLMTGSEGLLGVVTEVTVRIINKGLSEIKFLQASVQDGEGYTIQPQHKQAYLGNVDSDDWETMRLTVTTDRESIDIPLSYSFEDTFNNPQEQQTTLSVQIPEAPAGGLGTAGLLIALAVIGGGYWLYKRRKSKK